VPWGACQREQRWYARHSPEFEASTTFRAQLLQRERWARRWVSMIWRPAWTGCQPGGGARWRSLTSRHLLAVRAVPAYPGRRVREAMFAAACTRKAWEQLRVRARHFEARQGLQTRPCLGLVVLVTTLRHSTHCTICQPSSVIEGTCPKCLDTAYPSYPHSHHTACCAI
jgi:hypothetical protein